MKPQAPTSSQVNPATNTSTYVMPKWRSPPYTTSSKVAAADLNARIKDLEENQSNEEVQAAKREILLAEIMRTLGTHAHKIPAWLTRTDPSEVNRILHLLLEGIILHPNGTIELVYR